jgi:hypothetical protein
MHGVAQWMHAPANICPLFTFTNNTFNGVCALALELHMRTENMNADVLVAKYTHRARAWILQKSRARVRTKSWN